MSIYDILLGLQLYNKGILEFSNQKMICVDSRRLSNGKKKGENDRKNGNKYLAWAFVEAAHFAKGKEPAIKKFFQRKSSKTKQVVAIKAIAHKLARACYYIMRDGVSYDLTKGFV